jgi:hypothetical protein
MQIYLTVQCMPKLTADTAYLTWLSTIREKLIQLSILVLPNTANADLHYSTLDLQCMSKLTADTAFFTCLN